jgi:transcriptional regulator of NAD metabolism
MSETNGSGRRERIVELLREAHRAITGSELSVSLGVSRQAIVNDMAILRAGGEPIGGSPQGYHSGGDPSDTQPLSSLAGGVHRHRVRAPDEVALASARGDLELLGFLHEG